MGHLDPPGCRYDTVPCNGCSCDPSPLQNHYDWLEAQAGEDQDDVSPDNESERAEAGDVQEDGASSDSPVFGLTDL